MSLSVPVSPVLYNQNMFLLACYILSQLEKWPPVLQMVYKELAVMELIENLASQTYNFGYKFNDDEAQKLVTLLLCIRTMRGPDGFYESGDFYHSEYEGSNCDLLSEEVLNNISSEQFPGTREYFELSDDQHDQLVAYLEDNYKKINSDDLLDLALSQFGM